MQIRAHIVANAVLMCFMVVVAPSLAFAHPDVENARRRYERAEFGGALEALDDGLESSDLDLADLRELLELRALVHQAMDDTSGLDDTLRLLAIVDPEHEFGAEAPPDLRSRFEALRAESPGPVRVTVVTTPVAGGLSVEGRSENDRNGVVRTTRVYARTEGGAWADASGGPLTVQAASDARVEYYVEAIGPGGAPIASSGTRDEPLATTPGALLTNDDPDEPVAPPPATEDDGGTPWVLVGAGVGAAVIAVTTLVLVLALSGGQSDVTQPSPPMVDF